MYLILFLLFSNFILSLILRLKMFDFVIEVVLSSILQRLYFSFQDRF